MMDIFSGALEKAHCARHFLYFSTKSAAESAHGDIKAYGRTIKISQSGYDSRWLLLVSENCPDEAAFDASYAILKEVAEAFGGESDGYEFEIQNAIH